jgi:hypothetical protein
MNLWPPFSGFLDHTYRHTVGLLWTSDQPVAEASTYTGQHNIETQETNIHAPSGIRTRDPSNQAAADLRRRPRGHWDRHKGCLKNIKGTGYCYVWYGTKHPMHCDRFLLCCASPCPSVLSAKSLSYSEGTFNMP